MKKKKKNVKKNSKSVNLKMLLFKTLALAGLREVFKSRRAT